MSQNAVAFQRIELNPYASTVHMDPFEKENDLMSSSQQTDNIYPPLEGYFGEGEQRVVAIKFRYQFPGSSNALFAVICSDTSLYHPATCTDTLLYSAACSHERV
jgi:hypothetical protein